MLSDLSTLPDGVTVQGSLCIIGAGAAGMTLARQLAGPNTRVILLESGGLTEEPDTQGLYRGEEVGIPYLPLDACRLRYLGGTTNHWAGQSSPLEAADFAPRPWVPNSGWPIDHAELMRHLPAAKAMIGLGEEPFSWAFWSGKPGIAPFPFPGRFEPVVFQYSHPVARFGQLYGDDVRNSPDIMCLLHANVLRLVPNPSGGAISHVDVATLDGHKATVAAEHFVLAAGGIENCRILLLSPGPSGVAIGNGHDLVGRYFMEHPCFEVGEIKLSDAPNARMLAHRDFSAAGVIGRFDFKLPHATQSELGILNHSVHLRVAAPRHAYNDPVGFLSRAWSAAVDRVERWMGHGTPGEHYSRNTYKLRVRLEQVPDPENRVTLSDQVDALGLPRTRLALRLTDLEGKTVEALQEAVAVQLGETGLGRMRRTFSSKDPRWQERAIWSDHHIGGTRMHDDPRHGVVGRDCRVHGMANLFVAGSSVFPTTGQVHPTMNLLALALRLGEHLKTVMNA